MEKRYPSLTDEEWSIMERLNELDEEFKEAQKLKTPKHAKEQAAAKAERKADCVHREPRRKNKKRVERVLTRKSKAKAARRRAEAKAEDWRLFVKKLKQWTAETDTQVAATEANRQPPGQARPRAPRQEGAPRRSRLRRR